MAEVTTHLSGNYRTYADLIHSFSLTERHHISSIKRFFECLNGDVKFRTSVTANHSDSSVLQRLQNIGVDLHPDDLAPFLSEEQEEFIQYYQWLQSPPLLRAQMEKPEILLDLDRWPLVKLWFAWIEAKNSYVDGSQPLERLSDVAHPKFRNWLQRRILSAESELGHFGKRIDHPIFAFELSKGCSIGCWFCGFSSQKLTEVFRYTAQNQALWRGIVQIGQDLFGTAARWALCYYGTEPYDNPHYIDFLRDYRDITGGNLCTATAAAQKDPVWMRELLAFYRNDDRTPLPWPRLSVLSSSILRRLHDIYTADELRDAEMLMQMKSAPSQKKAAAGRLLYKNIEEEGGASLPEESPYVPQGSIACVSGFLVNMVDRTIKLVSPCYASERWPLGYRIFAETTFRTAADYRTAIERLLESNIAESPLPNMRLALRDDLHCMPVEGGFTLRSSYHKHHVKGNLFHQHLGELLTQGNLSYHEVMHDLTQHGARSFDVSRIVTKLFNKGLLDERLCG